MQTGDDGEWLKQWTAEGEHLFLNYLEYVPSGPARLEALRQCHDNPLARHFGFARTLEKLQ